ncbi:hypothetical protein [Streptomyces sp. NPDC056337]
MSSSAGRSANAVIHSGFAPSRAIASSSVTEPEGPLGVGAVRCELEGMTP